MLRPGKRIDALTLDLKATLLDITIRNGIDGNLAFTFDGYLLERDATTFYRYFFAPFIYNKIVTTFKIPPIPDPVIYMTLSDPSGIVEVNRFAIGQSVYLGPIQWNPIVDSDNYSEITWDDFGKSTLKPVPSMPLNELTIITDSNKVNLVRQFKEQANAKAAVWSGLDDIVSPYNEPLVMFGVYINFRIDVSNKNFVELGLSLKGV